MLPQISHWNKGPGFFQNKMPEIKNIISGLHPHIIGISEENLHQHHDQHLVQLDDYVLHTFSTINNFTLKTSRIAVYTHQSLVVKLRTDLMCDNYPSILMEVGLPYTRNSGLVRPTGSVSCQIKLTGLLFPLLSR